MDEYVIRFRCNLSEQSHDVPLELTPHELSLLKEIGEKVRMFSEWDFQMEILADTKSDSLETHQKRGRDGVRAGMIVLDEVNFPEGSISEE